MKRIFGGKELLLKAKKEAKRREKRRTKSRAKRVLKRQEKKLVGNKGAPSVPSREIPTLESANQN